MPDEGKFSRAMSKADLAGKRSPVPSEKPQEILPEQGQVAPPVHPKAKPVLRRIVGKADEPSVQAVFWHDTNGEPATQIRALRARILANGNRNGNGNPQGKAPRVIAVTSANRGEGKTTISMNLAAALSEIGEGRIIAVDGDLLGPTRSLSVVAGVTPESGLVDVLDRDLSLDGCIYETLVPNLDVLPSRALEVMEPGEHHAHEDDIESQLHQSCKALLARLAQEYAYVVVDTPPVRASSYACTFAKHCDMTIMVARLEKTSRHVVKRATKELSQAGAVKISCLLTHQKHHIPSIIYRLFGTPSSYYYGYRQGYGRSYGYGYGRPRSKKDKK